MKKRMLVCGIMSLLLLSACGQNGETTAVIYEEFYPVNGTISDSEKQALGERQLADRLQDTITAMENINSVDIQLDEADGSGKTVDVSVTTARNEALSPDQKAAIKTIVEKCFTEKVLVNIVENQDAG